MLPPMLSPMLSPMRHTKNINENADAPAKATSIIFTEANTDATLRSNPPSPQLDQQETVVMVTDPPEMTMAMTVMVEFRGHHLC